ncbi:MAG: hypothetical protein M0C28_27745 [Candidatus Moduliflexus flocculans]|nr:hypothetical protein [Candidatus Moduliflexus flocculans]
MPAGPVRADPVYGLRSRPRTRPGRSGWCCAAPAGPLTARTTRLYDPAARERVSSDSAQPLVGPVVEVPLPRRRVAGERSENCTALADVRISSG